jgi:hypothetical protein
MSAVTATTDVEVCNLALDLVKEAPILNFEENRFAARWMKRNFVPVVNMLMAKHVWKFAMTRAALPELSDAPAFEWRHQYRKPEDCLRVLPLREGGTLNGRLISHVVEGDLILTNATGPLLVRYLAAKHNPAEWPAPFVEAATTRLAAGIANMMTGKQSLVEVLTVTHERALAAAVSIDSAEGTHAEQYATAYDDARYYYSLAEGY